MVPMITIATPHQVTAKNIIGCLTIYIVIKAPIDII